MIRQTPVLSFVPTNRRSPGAIERTRAIAVSMFEAALADMWAACDIDAYTIEQFDTACANFRAASDWRDHTRSNR